MRSKHHHETNHGQIQTVNIIRGHYSCLPIVLDSIQTVLTVEWKLFSVHILYKLDIFYSWEYFIIFKWPHIIILKVHYVLIKKMSYLIVLYKLL